ncbi:proteoglycan 4b isoform X2 [Danio aesculapii]|uniref:proteoglycan 4b isoform X2 n=1 Tax=Danio aesculapii TaxID=1142201 RepID=UPI0024C00546|nr:proteoglycan 4b isoform X2 [Danio aesculapii]
MATYLSLLLLFVWVSTSSSNPRSCGGRCGEGYYRGSICQCDYDCLGLNECCTDFQVLCTSKDSCKGRCGEPFNRGNPCHCDIDCVSYNQCCPDYESMCLTEESSNEDMTNLEGTGDEFTVPEYEIEPTPSEAHDVPAEILPEGPYTLTSPEPAEDPRNQTPAEDPNQTPAENPTSPVPAEDPKSPVSVEDPTSPVPPEDPTNQTPSENPTSPVPADDPKSPVSVEDPTSPVPPEDPTNQTSAENPTSPVPPEDATNQTPAENPTSPVPPENPKSPVSPEDPTNQTPAENPTSPVPAEDPTNQTPAENPTSPVPAEDPTNQTPAENPTSPVPAEDPTNQTPAENPTSPVPAEGPKSPVPAEDPKNQTPAENAANMAQTEDPRDQTPAEDPASMAPTEGPKRMAPTEGPTSAAPTEGATPVPRKTPAPMKPTKKPTQPSKEKNDISEVKESPKDPVIISPIRVTEKPLKPSSDQNGKTDHILDYQSDDYDSNLCSGRPVSGLTTLRNGTIVVFRGHYFWTLDKQRNPDPPQLITRVWGIPSPIDTVYTRCNCQGKTYFFKGKSYWRFENGAMDPGFPKPISEGFGQIGHITAALSIPEYRSRKESVIFFKRGGMAQKYTYQVTPDCGRRPKIPVITVRMRTRRQTAAALGQVINISRTWRGFPTMVTSSVSVPSRVKEGYKYYVFSQRNYYSMKMEREKPVILKPVTGPKENPATSFFKCKDTQKI